MLNTQVLTPLSKKKKKKVVQVLAIDNMEKYLLHISEKNVWLMNTSSDQGLWNIDEKIIFY